MMVSVNWDSTADLILKARNAEIKDDFWIAGANCLNISEGVRRDCVKGAALERNEGLDFCEEQLDAVLSWRTGRSMSITLEYLRGVFQNGLAEIDDGIAHEHVDHLGALLSIAF